MGMDISGKEPINESGEYFRFSIWSWSPCAQLIETVRPDLARKIEYLYSNDGSGLNKEDSIELGFSIQNFVNSEDYEKFYRTLPEKETGWSNSKVTGWSKFIEKERILEFAEFLKNCGGFEIW